MLLYFPRDGANLYEECNRERAGMWDPRTFRLRSFLAIAFVTILIAAGLRHVLHVYGGIPRYEIGEDALLAIMIVVVVMVLIRVLRR